MAQNEHHMRHYKMSTKKDLVLSLFIDLTLLSFLVLGFARQLITGRQGYVYPGVRKESGDMNWPIFVFNVLGIIVGVCFAIGLILEIIRSENTVYLDVGEDGIFIDLKPPLVEHHPSPYACKWKDIQYVSFERHVVTFTLRIKPYKEETHKYTFLGSPIRVLFLRRAILKFSGRPDIVRKYHKRKR